MLGAICQIQILTFVWSFLGHVKYTVFQNYYRRMDGHSKVIKAKRPVSATKNVTHSDPTPGGHVLYSRIRRHHAQHFLAQPKRQR